MSVISTLGRVLGSSAADRWLPLSDQHRNYEITCSNCETVCRNDETLQPYAASYIMSSTILSDKSRLSDTYYAILPNRAILTGRAPGVMRGGIQVPPMMGVPIGLPRRRRTWRG